MDVIREANKAGPMPVVFVRGVGLAHAQSDDDDRPIIPEHDVHSLRSILANAAEGAINEDRTNVMLK